MSEKAIREKHIQHAQRVGSVGEKKDCVEIVRCKDCKYLSTSHSVETMNGEKMYRCFYEVSRLYVNPYDYCSYGDREEE